MALLFWFSVMAIFVGYVGYPIFLYILGIFRQKPYITCDDYVPRLSVIVPVYNGEHIIASKIDNLLQLDYPEDRVEFIVVSDASSDNTGNIVQSYDDDRLHFHELNKRTGKAGGLNLALGQANHEILVFTDASILLDRGALREIVKPFCDDSIGCVSGEDYIPGQSNEGLYGRYELMIRNLESRIASIVGASGCFYAQRKNICDSFPEGMAPDFYSVLKTVEKGYRAVTHPSARGQMGYSKNSGHEFARKVRTLIRGITALVAMKHLMDFRHYGLFSLELLGHKVLRWTAGIFLVFSLVSNLFLISNFFYLILFVAQICFYFAAFMGMKESNNPKASPFFRISFFFCVVNFAALYAIYRFLLGTRIEIWEPTKR